MVFSLTLPWLAGIKLNHYSSMLDSPPAHYFQSTPPPASPPTNLLPLTITRCTCSTSSNHRHNSLNPQVTQSYTETGSFRPKSFSQPNTDRSDVTVCFLWYTVWRQIRLLSKNGSPPCHVFCMRCIFYFLFFFAFDAGEGLSAVEL